MRQLLDQGRRLMLPIFGNDWKIGLKGNSPNNCHNIAKLFYEIILHSSISSVILPKSGNCWIKVGALGCQYWKVFGNLDLKNNSPNNRRIIAKLFIE
jgi:hypothetical protein